MTSNGWNEWKNKVLSDLERIGTAVEHAHEVNMAEHKEIRDSISCHREETASEISALKVKAGIWGFIAGFIPPVGVLIYWLLQ
jgi:hypothetical protein